MSLHDTAPFAVEAHGIVKEYPGVRALRGVSLSVRAGEVHALLGENGAGKSTLIKIVTGVERPDQGTVSIAGETVRTFTPRAAQGHGVRTVHQERQIAPDLTVGENVLLGTFPRGHLGLLTRYSIIREAQRHLDRLGLGLDAAAPAATITAAEQQLVELARALSRRASVVVLDEPTASLRRDEVDKLFSAIRHLRETGTAVLYISHHLHEIFEIADRATVMRNGENVAELDVAETDEDEIVTLMFDRNLAHTRLPREMPVDRPVTVELRGAALAPVLAPCDLEVRRGEVLALCGTAGSGTSEIAELVAGAKVPTMGGVLRHGGEAVGARPQAAAGGIGFVPADRKADGLLLEQAISDNVGLGPQRGRDRWAYEGPRSRRVARGSFQRAGGADVDVRRPVGTLSGGNQQRVVLARWLRAESEVIVLDQPTAGVDIASKFDIYRELLSLTAQGMAVVVVSSDYQEICALADRVAVLRDGVVVASMSGDEATPDLLYQLETGLVAG